MDFLFIGSMSMDEPEGKIQTHPMPNETFRKKQTSSARRERNRYLKIYLPEICSSKKVVSLQNCDKKVLRQCRGNEIFTFPGQGSLLRLKPSNQG